MTLKVVKTCPLGSQCQQVVNGELHVCEWFTVVKGTNPQTGEPLDEEGCAIRLNLLVSLNGAKAQDRATNTLHEGAQLFRKVLNAADSSARELRGSGSEHRLASSDATTEHSN